MIEIALYQPDIPQNTGTILRTAACLGLKVHIIEPAGFQWSMSSFRRAGMDYVEHVEIIRQPSHEAFINTHPSARIILATTKATTSYTDFKFARDDILLFGRESAGVPQSVHDQITHQITIPIRPQTRSLNIAVSVAMIAGEALRQIQLA